MQRLEVSGAVRPIYGSLGVKRLTEGHDSMEYTKLKKKIRRKNEGIIQLNTPNLGFKKSGEEHNGIIQWDTLNVRKFKRKQEGNN